MNNRATSFPCKKPHFNLSPNWWDRRAAERTKGKATQPPKAHPQDPVSYGALMEHLFRAFDEYHLDRHEWPSSPVCWKRAKLNAERAGFEYLGSGHFSAVFSHEAMPNVAFKLGLKKEDSGAAYAAWCRQNQGRPGVPELYEIKRRGTRYMVAMKRYVPLGDAPDSSRASNVLRELQAVVGEGVKWDEKAFLVRVGYHCPRALYEVARDIRKFFKGIARFDLHGDNAMFDPDTQQVVITDPVSYNGAGTVKVNDRQYAPTVSQVVVREIAALREQQARAKQERWPDDLVKFDPPPIRGMRVPAAVIRDLQTMRWPDARDHPAFRMNNVDLATTAVRLQFDARPVGLRPGDVIPLVTRPAQGKVFWPDAAPPLMQLEMNRKRVEERIMMNPALWGWSHLVKKPNAMVDINA